MYVVYMHTAGTHFTKQLDRPVCYSLNMNSRSGTGNMRPTDNSPDGDGRA